MGMHRLTDIRSVAQQLARGAVAQWVATGAEVGVDMPHQVPITRMEGSSSSKGGTTETPTCPPPLPLPPSSPCTTQTRYTLRLACPSGIQGSDRAKQGGVRVCLQQQPDCSQRVLPGVAREKIMQLAWQLAAADNSA